MVNASTKTWIALLGRGDATADGVQDYCEYLARALERRGVELKLVSVDWVRKGWWAALRELQARKQSLARKWVLVAIHGPCVVAPRISSRCPRSTCGCSSPWRSLRCRIPRAVQPAGLLAGLIVRAVQFQEWIIRKIYNSVAKNIFPEPLSKIRWLPSGEPKARFIPIGANIPERHPISKRSIQRKRKTKDRRRILLDRHAVPSR